MGVPHITSFCWCYGLESGTKVIGFLHLVVSLCLMSLCSVFAEEFRASVDTIEDAEGLYTKWYKITVVTAVFSVVHVALAITLIYAAYKRHSGAMRVWVWAMLALYAAALLSVLVTMTFGFSSTGSDIFISFLEGVLFFAILAYCILCVNSFYLMLRSAEDMDAPRKTDY